jgi:purine-binding chemotaxis protein CheW
MHSDMTTKQSFITFSVSDQLFCLSVEHVQSIQKLPKVFVVPQAPQYIMGVVNVDGDVIPLINATVKLKMGEYHAPENAAILVLERLNHGKQQKLGLHVNEVADVIELNPLDIKPLPTSKYEFDERLVDGMFQTADDFIMKLNVENFFKHNLEELNLDTYTKTSQI